MEEGKRSKNGGGEVGELRRRGMQQCGRGMGEGTRVKTIKATTSMKASPPSECLI